MACVHLCSAVVCHCVRRRCHATQCLGQYRCCGGEHYADYGAVYHHEIDATLVTPAKLNGPSTGMIDTHLSCNLQHREGDVRGSSHGLDQPATLQWLLPTPQWLDQLPQAVSDLWRWWSCPSHVRHDSVGQQVQKVVAHNAGGDGCPTIKSHTTGATLSIGASCLSVFLRICLYFEEDASKNNLNTV